MSEQQNKDINKFATIFGQRTGRVSLEKSLPTYFEGVDWDKLPNKTSRIIYILTNNKSNINELQFIVQQILSTHDGWRDKVEIINNVIKSIGLSINTDSYTVETLSERGVEDVIDDVQKEVPSQIPIEKILPSEILNKGKKMSEAYLLIYCFENTLRIFIEGISEKKYGNSYWNSLNIPKELNEKVKSRKTEEQKNLFHSLRGDKELYYLDMDDLGRIIEQNWELFKMYFPNQYFIRQRITETVTTRNLVAHNSWISPDDFNRVLGYYKDILKQLSIV